MKFWAGFSSARIGIARGCPRTALQEKIGRVAVMLLILLWHLLNYGFRAQDWILYAVGLTVIAFFEVMWPLFVYRGKGSIRERFLADEVAEAPIRARGIAGRIFVALGPAAYSVLFALIFGTMLATTAGKAKAATQREYFVLADTPDIVVLRMYHDTILAAPFDRKMKSVLPQLIIRKIGTENVRLSEVIELAPLFDLV